MSKVRLLAPAIREQVFEMLRDEVLPMQAFAVSFGDFAIVADELATFPRTNAATYHLRHAGAEAGQRAGEPVRVLLRRDSPTKLGQAFKYPHGWRDVVYDLGNAWQTDTEVLIGFRMMNGGAGRNRWFGRRDGKVETRTPAMMEQLATRLRQELRQAFAAENPGTDTGLPRQWLTVARLPLAAPDALEATSETKSLLLSQLSQALVIGETLRRESFGEDDAAPAYYLLGAVHKDENQKGEDQVERFLTQGIWENGDREKYGALVALLKPGDRVALKSSYATRKEKLSMLRVKARGTVQATAADGHELRVAWDAPFPPFDLPGLGNYQQTIHHLTKPADIAAIFHLATSPTMPAHPLNQILYGPPGTGKTYSTTAWALALLHGITTEEVALRFATEQARYDEFERLRQQGQIGFVSFHQSFGYEDFVEGIKPVLNDDEENGVGLNYQIEAGIFKRMAERAVNGLELEPQSESAEVSPDLQRNFDSAFAGFSDFLKRRLTTEPAGSVAFQTKAGKRVILKRIGKNDTFYLRYSSGDEAKNIPVTKDTLSRIYKHYLQGREQNNSFDHIIKIPIGGDRSAYWAVFKELQDFESKNPSGINPASIHLEDDNNFYHKKADNFTQLAPADYAAAPRFVLIIDEINRGNVASIFGELISLLEDDKRGRMRVTLPYSKEEFTVPPNLYVLGTMNTADRSVEALDTALRRRFSFHELAPQPQLLPADVEGIDLRALLAALNDRLETLLDRDHRLGHAWLLQVRSLTELRAVFSHKVIPQLQEYFYGHWGRMGQVLGTAFVRPRPAAAPLMPGFDDDPDGPGAEPAPRYELTPAAGWMAEDFRRLYAH